MWSARESDLAACHRQAHRWELHPVGSGGGTPACAPARLESRDRATDPGVEQFPPTEASNWPGPHAQPQRRLAGDYSPTQEGLERIWTRQGQGSGGEGGRGLSKECHHRRFDHHPLGTTEEETRGVWEENEATAGELEGDSLEGAEGGHGEDTRRHRSEKKRSHSQRSGCLWADSEVGAR